MDVFEFHEMIDDGPDIRVLARLSVLRTEDGGRKGPFTTGYRPNHNFFDSDNIEFYFGHVEVPQGELIHPGETRVLAISFLSGPGLASLLQPGRTWRIQEGPTLVARAKLLAWLDD